MPFGFLPIKSRFMIRVF